MIREGASKMLRPACLVKTDRHSGNNLLSNALSAERYDSESVNDKPKVKKDRRFDSTHFTFRDRCKPNGIRRACLIFATMSVALISFCAYKRTLAYFFAGTDTFTLIETARLTSAKDLIKILCNPLMAGSGFVSRALFYRPVSSLSYSLDYFLWGLNPFGYHLTNLILHVLVTALVLILVVSLTNGDVVKAWASALIFSLHPILIESVPAPDCRHDLLAAFILVSAFILFIRARDGGAFSKVGFGLSVLCYGLALGSKEIAVVFPCLTFAYILIFSDPGCKRSRRIWAATRRSAVYLGVTLVYMAWRTVILGGLGGYSTESAGSTFCHRVMDIVVMYLRDLVYPQDFLSLFGTISMSLLILLLTSLVAVHGWDFRQSSGTDQESHTKLARFFLVWLCLPIAVMVFTLTFSHRTMYTAVIPFAALLGCNVVSGIRHHASLLKEVPGNRTLAGILGLVNMTGLSFSALVLNAALVVSLLAYSPLIRSYSEWEASSQIASSLFKKLAEVIPALPQDTLIEVHNLPAAVQSYRSEIPRAREVGYLNGYSIKSWIDLNYPGNHIQVSINSRHCPRRTPEDMHLLVKVLDKTNTRLSVLFVHDASAMRPRAVQWRYVAR